MWREAGPPPDLATRLFTERIMYLVCQSSMTFSGADPDSLEERGVACASGRAGYAHRLFRGRAHYSAAVPASARSS